MTKLISIDQSLSKSALVEWVDGVPVDRYVFKSGSEKSKKHLANVTYFETVDEQMEFLADKMLERVNIFKPDHITMEGLAFGSVGNATRDLAGLYYVMRNAFYQAGYNWNQMTATPPISAKSVARGFLPVALQTVPKPNGKEGTNKVKMEKPLMIAAVPEAHRWLYDGFALSGLKAGKDDLADAYFLGVFYYEKIQKS